MAEKKKMREGKYPGRAPVDKKVLKKYYRGTGVEVRRSKTKIKNKYNIARLKKREKLIEKTLEDTARAELLLTESGGYLETDAGETTTQFRQTDIAANVDITSAAKFFDLDLAFGPYYPKYTRNGRHLLLGGKMGHVAAFDWVTKKLSCEMNVMESVHDVTWFHQETMFAVAQKEWVYVYDNQGIEIHCLKRMNRATKLEFLPYHFLLCSGSSDGNLAWVDVSTGELLKRYNTQVGKIRVMTQNPTNALLLIGNSKGVVSMWSPNLQEPLVRMLCHRQAISACTVHPYGTYMATSCPDRSLKIWDARQLTGPVHNIMLRSPADNVAYSQKGMLAVSTGNVVEVFKESGADMKRYLSHRSSWNVSGMQFCPFEDVLGVGSEKKFTSLLIPGSAEANFDALEINPFQTKSQRNEREVKSLLDKIQPEFITLNPEAIAEVDVSKLKEKVDAKNKLPFVKPKNIDFKPRETKAKGKGGTAKVVKTKKILKELEKRKEIESLPTIKKTKVDKKVKKNYGQALNRFLPK
ncbi:GSCOCG00009574001-RA-CDS [Cotesia congregata]|uniref:Similar to WDR46: WD repeat-containing protein 46 (Homo sapiens) n=1 Tax=Cotesia congregata TaxID=51543 RepID=A0A8J2HCT4_COTCN|nr:GSCOCG00009574001-RA-CDS [Cotesia congregata]CAG5094948.1 Similar to WDR46: WD repeat-containing protein 46 (Homo sapiens) [Cotesia congregata]